MAAIGMLFALVGGAVWLVGGVMLLIVAFKRSVLWGLGSLIMPFVILVFVALNWKESKRGFLLSLAGAAIMILGIVPMTALGGPKYEEKILSDGSRYSGETKQGPDGNEVPHGHGTLISPRGVEYVGEFQDGVKSGQGTETSPEGWKYAGEFQNGERNGQGTWTHPEFGQKYVGEFKDGLRHGQGTFTEDKVDRTYVGEWKNNRPDGRGKMTNANLEGSVEDGYFRDGEFLGQSLPE